MISRLIIIFLLFLIVIVVYRIDDTLTRIENHGIIVKSYVFNEKTGSWDRERKVTP
jgi:hypothetical protein